MRTLMEIEKELLEMAKADLAQSEESARTLAARIPQLRNFIAVIEGTARKIDGRTSEARALRLRKPLTTPTEKSEER